jgi:hypothetical protein
MDFYPGTGTSLIPDERRRPRKQSFRCPYRKLAPGLSTVAVMRRKTLKIPAWPETLTLYHPI